MIRSLKYTIFITSLVLCIQLICQIDHVLAQSASASNMDDPDNIVQAPPEQAQQQKEVSGFTGDVIRSMSVRGNTKVESEAILTIIGHKVGNSVDKDLVQDDIRKLFELGYFSDVRIYKKPASDQLSAPGIELIVEVKEKPAITSIEYKGMEEITEEDVQEKLETRLYMIVNEATIASDVRMIEKQYSEKGFYLTGVTYTLESEGENEVALVFHIDEGEMVHVGEVFVLGNEYYTDQEIIAGVPGVPARMLLQPYTRSAAFGSGSIYQDEFVDNDVSYISYIYQDQGFADVKVAKAVKVLDSDRKYVRVTFQVEEGIQYRVGKINVSGDVLFPEQELIDDMKIKSDGLFRISQFRSDIEKLNDKYGDLGYAYADVNPLTKFDREKQIVDINYEITKGDKVYFGNMVITGNTKTRDNVIRREFEVVDSQLYHSTGMRQTKRNIERLGYFEEVQIIKERDSIEKNLMHLKVRVKEKPTGQLQAAVGFTPTNSGNEGSNWFLNGSYDEKNQSGKGWRLNISGKSNGDEDNSIGIGFSDPRLNDSIWSAGIRADYSNSRISYLGDVSAYETRVSSSVYVGRKIFELIRGRITYKIERINREFDEYSLESFRDDGITSSLFFSLIRNSVDNYLEPTEGTELTLRQRFAGGPILRGDFEFMESTYDGSYYVPIDYSDTFRTYFKIRSLLSYVYPMSDEPVPQTARYRLGGNNDLRGYRWSSIGPKISTLKDPTGRARHNYNKGGDKKLLFQTEYFVPVLPEAGIKSLLFWDAGRVYDDEESLELQEFHHDVGFGFRWITPVAPFRFEWAYPIEEGGRLGDMNIIFSIGF